MASSEDRLAGLYRREHHRARYSVDVEIVSGTSKLYGRITDISMGGMLVEMENALSLGAEFVARIPAGEGPPLELSCLVKQVVPSVCMGVEFTELKPAEHARLRELIERLPH